MKMTTVKAKKAPAKSGKSGSKKLRGVHITRGDNGGYMTEAHNDNSGDGPYVPPTTAMHTSKADMLSHVGGLFPDDAAAKPAAPAAPPAEEEE